MGASSSSSNKEMFDHASAKTNAKPLLSDDYLNDVMEDSRSTSLSSYVEVTTNLGEINDPMQWTPAEVHRWLAGTKYKPFLSVPTLVNIDGESLCFITKKSLVEMTTSVFTAKDTEALAEECHEELRGMRINAGVERQIVQMYNESRNPEDKRGNTNQDKNKPSFPELFFIPSPLVSILVLLTSVITYLSLTTYRSNVEDFLHTDMDTIVRYGSIPLISMAFTYCHIWLALWMTFFPLEFIGTCQIPGTNVGFPFGWQGIIPFKAEKMARLAVRLMTEQLIDVKEEFSKIDVNRVSEELDDTVFKKLKEVITTTFERHQGNIWGMLPKDVKDEMVLMGSESGPRVIKRIMEEVKEDILKVFDIEEFVVNFMTGNKKLLNKVFIQCGWDELCFIRDCGALLGGFFGLIQMLIWIPFHPDVPDEYLHPGWQSLTVFLGFGLVVGSATNWLALKIIFEPIDPVNLGCYTLQGLFLKRQKQISEVYGEITANEVLSAKNILKEMLTGSNNGTLREMIRRHLVIGCDEFIGTAVRPVVRAAIGDTMDTMRDEAIDSIMADLGSTMEHAEGYTQEALDMQNTLSSRMSALPSRQFERLLHPVFEEDEWKLVLMGGVLGVVIGALQAYFIN